MHSSVIPCLLAASLSCLPASATTATLNKAPVTAEVKMATFSDRCQPIANLIARGEGTWDSVNRGYAGDTPRGIRSITNRSFKDMTIEEVIWLQRGSIYTVGRYQMIPTTFKQAVKWSRVGWDAKLTNEVQDKLFCTLLKHKRPSVAAYLNGGGDLNKALNALAMEWACVEYRNGRGYYDGHAGNRASVSRYEAMVALNVGRAL